MGTLTVETRGSLSPCAGGLVTVKITSPEAMPVKSFPECRTEMCRARDPWYGQILAEYSNSISRCLPPSSEGTQPGGDLSSPVLDMPFSLFERKVIIFIHKNIVSQQA